MSVLDDDGKRDTKRTLAAGAAELIERYGYDRASIDDIAKNADVTKPTFYYHYRSKLELLTELLEDSMTRIETSLASAEVPDAPPDVRLAHLVRAYALEVLDRSNLWKIYYRDRDLLDPDRLRSLKQRERKVIALFEGVIDDGVETGKFRPVAPLVAAMAVIGMVTSLHRWYKDRGEANRDLVVAEYVSLAVAGLMR